MAAKAIVVGIDLGAADSYVAYVGKGNVDLVQNEVSQRATPTIVGFTDRERLLGEPALAQIRSNGKNSCRNFKHLLGRKLEASDLAIEHFWSTSPLCSCADGHAGYEVNYKGERRQMSAVECAAMYLTQLREIAEKWCGGQLAQCVIAVPSYFSDVQRQAVLDAAQVANLKVLQIMNEYTATALAYGIYRSNDFDPTTPMTVAFCSMGHSVFSVSIVQFVRGKLQVLCERSDKVGSRELDECLMREFAAQFKKKVGADPLTNKKASFKLEDAVKKTKKVLSANSDAPVNVECLMEDEDFASVITREDLERMCEPAMVKVRAVLDAAIKASELSLDQIDSVEIVGGGSRVPWVKRLCSEAFGGKALSTTMNQEESVARGCALQAAILSPLYKVRDFAVVDVNSHPINVGWMGQAAVGSTAEDTGDEETMGVDGEFNSFTIFPAGCPLNTQRVLSFKRTSSFDIKVDFADDASLPELTPKELGLWHVHVPPQSEPMQIKVWARLTLNGTFEIEAAKSQFTEEYEEVTKEKREVAAEAPAEGKSSGIGGMFKSMFGGDKKGEAEAKEEAKAEPKAEGEADSSPQSGTEAKPQKGEKAEAEKKYEYVEVKKKKTRMASKELKVSASCRPGLPPKQLQQLMDAETGMQADMREIIATNAARNDVEAYIFNMRDKCSESGEYKDFITPEERSSFLDALTKAEDWLYDNYEGTKAMFVDKLTELKKDGDAIVWRCKEDSIREEWIAAVQGTIANYREAAVNPGEKFGHVAPEKLAGIVDDCAALEQWLEEMKQKQAALAKSEPPVLLCADLEKKSQELAAKADAVLQKPKEPTKSGKADGAKNGATNGATNGHNGKTDEGSEKPEGNDPKTEEQPQAAETN